MRVLHCNVINPELEAAELESLPPPLPIHNGKWANECVHSAVFLLSKSSLFISQLP